MLANGHCMILAAGFGTRMGLIGTQLPKVMWPVFECSLLELQVQFARHLGYEKIWINLHHQADLILERAQRRPAFKGIRWLRETPEILDIGGGIHNLAAQPEVNYSGELLVLNADQFLWFTASDLESWRTTKNEWDVLLLNWLVDSSHGYNQVKSDTDRNFLGVIKNSELPRDLKIETYSGNSLINLSKIRRVGGPSAFFDSVCNPSYQKCKTALLRQGKYWDFGTAQRYWRSMLAVLQAKARGDEDAFTNFLVQTGAFVPSKFNPSGPSYNTNCPGVIHLGTGAISQTRPAGVVLEGISTAQSGSACLEFNGVTQAL